MLNFPLPFLPTSPSFDVLHHVYIKAKKSWYDILMHPKFCSQKHMVRFWQADYCFFDMTHDRRQFIFVLSSHKYNIPLAVVKIA